MEAFVELISLFHEGGYLAAGSVIVAGWWAYRALRKDIKKDINEAFELLEKRLDKIDRTLEIIQQNHLDHLSQLHITPMSTESINQAKTQ